MNFIHAPYQITVITPTPAPAPTSQAEFTLNRMSRTALSTASPIVSGSIRAACPSCQVTAAINAMEAALTPSKKAPAVGDLRRRGMIGPLTATKKKAGRKIPSVATVAPGTPPSTNPMKVAVVNTGPGVT